MSQKFYITTPIYYINDVPHIGHAYTTIAADVLARFHRSKGDEVFFLTGTDEHGAKIAEAAEKAGKSPKEFVEELRPKFKETWKNLNISNDEFFYTTNPAHEKLVQEFVLTLKEKGFVEKRQYEGLYCVGCERFLKEAELEGGLCPDHKKPPVKQTEENYFFKLSAISDKLSAAIESGELQIEPSFRKNEVLGKIKQGLEDISISRQAVEWGVPFPGDESQTIYVWIDALLNYYTATKIYGHDSHLGGAGTPSTPEVGACPVWPADLHLMAKDILWFHAVIWPAMLIAADIPVPKKVFAHGFFTINGAKMSKTVGNVIDPNEVVAKFGADAVRYALLREFPFGEDGDISVEKIEAKYNSDLANGLGNLLNRTLNMIKKYDVRPVLPDQPLFDKTDFTRDDCLVYGNYINSEIVGSEGCKREHSQRFYIENMISNLQFDLALKEIWRIVGAGNADIDINKPWELASSDKKEELSKVLNRIFEILTSISEIISPFMPETSEKMKKQLETLEPEPLFPRLES